uniref:Uncharacterized protein n=1 Tax=Chrysotila carterae TaxID=13221 RepID=A0A7S4BJ87_CHRCT
MQTPVTSSSSSTRPKMTNSSCCLIFRRATSPCSLRSSTTRLARSFFNFLDIRAYALRCAYDESRRPRVGATRSMLSFLLKKRRSYPGYGQERMEKYLGGGVLLVTTRILTVDMLCARVPFAHVSGVIVANAHRVGENSNISFIMRMFRQHNTTGFVRALSDDAASLTAGFSKVEKIVRDRSVYCTRRERTRSW